MTVTQSLVALVQSIPEAQTLCDTAYEDDMQNYRRVVQEIVDERSRSLALAMAPERVIIASTEVEASVVMRKSRQTQFELSVQLLNLGLRRRYAESAYSECRLRVSLCQTPHKRERINDQQ